VTVINIASGRSTSDTFVLLLLLLLLLLLQSLTISDNKDFVRRI